jgi:tight adherence protein B
VQAGIFDARAVAMFFIVRTALAICIAAALFFVVPMFKSTSSSVLWMAVIAGGIAGYVGPSMYLDRRIAARRLEHRSGFPDFMDLMVVCADAGLPIEAALERIGREFGIVSDEITYGADLETAIRDLYFRVGSEDLPLFVTAIAIQSSTGGNLAEILENLSSVIRQRFKMRRKIKALAAEGRASALILSSLPIGIFLAILFVTPQYYSSVWHESLTKMCLAVAGGWMGIGNLIMYRMVNFRI